MCVRIPRAQEFILESQTSAYTFHSTIGELPHAETGLLAFELWFFRFKIPMPQARPGTVTFRNGGEDCRGPQADGRQ